MATCYRLVNSTITRSYNYGACSSSSSSTASCCSTSHTCLSSGFCAHPNSSLPGGFGYYRSGCTDSTFNDPTCVSTCKGYPAQDAVWLSDQKLWQCCGGTGDSACNSPNGITFQGPDPGTLTAEAVILNPGSFSSLTTGSATGSMPTSSETRTSMPTGSLTIGSELGTLTPVAGSLVVTGTTSLSTPASSSSITSNGVSQGTIAGIALGVVAILALLAAFVAWLVVSKRRKGRAEDQATIEKSANGSPEEGGRGLDASLGTDTIGKNNTVSPSELSTHWEPAELPGQKEPQELGHGLHRSRSSLSGLEKWMEKDV